MKFGDWTYDGSFVDILQDRPGNISDYNEWDYPVTRLEQGMDLSYFQEYANSRNTLHQR